MGIVHNRLSEGDLQDAIYGALKSWGQLGGTEEDLLGFLLLVQEQRAEIGDVHSPSLLRQATNTVLESGIEELSQHDSLGAEVLRARFIDGEMTRRVAVMMHASTDQVNRWQKGAIADLAKILLGRETARREARVQRLAAELPPPTYSQLFGLDEVTEEVIQQSLLPGPPWVVIVGGIGGIGKTSLADAACRQIGETLTFERLLWLRASNQGLSGEALPSEQSYEQLMASLVERLWPEAPAEESLPEQLARVRRKLNSRPYLVVIDNLETPDTTNYIIEQIQALLEPTKFLLTTRARPGAEASASAYFVSLDELSLADTSALIRHQAEIVGLTDLAQAGNEDLEAIYAITGGNPLALKLVVGLATVLSLPQVLDDLSRSRPGPIEELYLHIYWKAWHTLSQDAQALLQAMPLVAGTGALPVQLQAISGLTEEQLWPAATELISRSLLEVRGTIHERRYGIHRLTETFLRTEIIDWPEP